MGWAFPWLGDMTQQLQTVLSHLSLSFATVPAPNVRTADVFGNGILKLTSSAVTQVHRKPQTPLACSFPPHLLASQTSICQNLTTALENSLASLFDFTQPIADLPLLHTHISTALWPVSTLSHPRILSVEFRLSSGTCGTTRRIAGRPTCPQVYRLVPVAEQTWACGFHTSSGRRGKTYFALSSTKCCAPYSGISLVTWF
jgi:hypothetical protein